MLSAVSSHGPSVRNVTGATIERQMFQRTAPSRYETERPPVTAADTIHWLKVGYPTTDACPPAGYQPPATTPGNEHFSAVTRNTGAIRQTLHPRIRGLHFPQGACTSQSDCEVELSKHYEREIHPGFAPSGTWRAWTRSSRLLCSLMNGKPACVDGGEVPSNCASRRSGWIIIMEGSYLDWSGLDSIRLFSSARVEDAAESWVP